jgi:chemotaxis protein histidine kinase CheA
MSIKKLLSFLSAFILFYCTFLVTAVLGQQLSPAQVTLETAKTAVQEKEQQLATAQTELEAARAAQQAAEQSVTTVSEELATLTTALQAAEQAAEQESQLLAKLTADLETAEAKKQEADQQLATAQAALEAATATHQEAEQVAQQTAEQVEKIREEIKTAGVSVTNPSQAETPAQADTVTNDESFEVISAKPGGGGTITRVVSKKHSSCDNGTIFGTQMIATFVSDEYFSDDALAEIGMGANNRAQYAFPQATGFCVVNKAGPSPGGRVYVQRPGCKKGDLINGQQGTDLCQWMNNQGFLDEEKDRFANNFINDTNEIIRLITEAGYTLSDGKEQDNDKKYAVSLIGGVVK